MRPISKALLIAAATSSLALATVPSHAQNACFEREDALARLQNLHGEAVIARGLTSEGKEMVELLATATIRRALLISFIGSSLSKDADLSMD